MHLPDDPSLKIKKIIFQKMTGYGDAGYWCISWSDALGYGSSLREMDHLPMDMYILNRSQTKTLKKNFEF
jgi:hypothetical protein